VPQSQTFLTVVLGDSNAWLPVASDPLDSLCADCLFVSRGGVGIRHPYWTRVVPRLRAETWIINIGFNDTRHGCEDYPASVDTFLGLLAGRAFWSTVFVVDEDRRAGCEAINDALCNAQNRWANLTVVDWASVARATDLRPDGVHLSPEGGRRWAEFVAQHVTGSTP
jgi:hypothetical protein